jgi:hypothetical protein
MSKHGSRPSFATGTTTKVVSALVSFAVLYSIFLTTIPASAEPDPACDFSALSPGPITATVASELPDYSPGATVNLSGFGFSAGEIVCFRVSEDNPEEIWNLRDSTLADTDGNLAFSVTISPDFVAQYRVRAWGLTSGVYAETTFTDAPGQVAKIYQHWADQLNQSGGPSWQGDILSAGKSDYFEGEVIPHVLVYKASNQSPLTNGATYSFNVTYNYYQQNTNAGGFAYMTTFNLSRQPGPLNATNPYITPTIDNAFANGGGMQGAFFSVDANITNVSAVTYTGSGSKDGHVTITFTYTGTTTTNGIAEVYYGLYVAQPGQVPNQGSGPTDGANAWSGGSLQTDVDGSSIQLAPDAIIAGQISGVKFNDLDGDGVKDSGEPLLPGWTIQLCADSACNTILQTTTTGANGAYSFSVTPDADKTTPANDPYYVREVNQSGWTQTAPTTVYYGPLTISAATPQYLNQDFGNQKDQGYLKISKVFDPKTSGFSGNFTIKYNCGAGDQMVQLAANTSTTVGPFDAGTNCTVSEPTVPTAPTGWAFGVPTLNPSNGQVTIVKGNQASAVTVTVTNTITRDTGSLKIKKIFDPGTSGFVGTFAISYDCNDGTAHDGTANLAAGGETTISGIPTGTECTVSEPSTPTPPTGWTFGTPTLSDDQAPTGDGKVTINDKAATYTVEVTNTIKTGHLRVVKTVGGQPVSVTNNCMDVSGNIVGCTFQLRTGASITQNGNTLESKSTLVGGQPVGMLNFTTLLAPGQHYQLCEIVMPGWLTSLGTFVPNSFMPPDGVAPNPSVDNSILCVDFIAQADTTDPGNIYTVDNTPPPGGRGLTIGFWKNWASCKSSNGGQKPILDETLAKAETNGIVMSATSGTYPIFGPTFYLVLHGSTTNKYVAPDCLKAVRLLEKSTIDGKKKMASDPAFNLSAQLLAAELNYVAGAGKKPAVTSAIQQAVLLLGKYKFDGNTHTAISSADATTMNNLAKLLDDYNNNRL